MTNPTGAEMVEEIRNAKPDPKKKTLTLLRTVKRDGIEDLIAWLEASGFFIAPAAMKHHGCYPGGLVAHCLSVYNKIIYMDNVFQFMAKPNIDARAKPLPLTADNFVIAAICHDLCKVGTCIGKDDGTYYWNKSAPKGHARLSIQRASEFIKLTPIEEMMIRFHMGTYGLHEFYDPSKWDAKNGEFHLRGDHRACQGMSKEESQAFRYGKSLANAWYHNPIVKFFYFADELATQSEKSKEN